MLRVTADTNIYISALNFGGLPEKLLDLARAGAVQLTISPEIISEVMRVLRLKFHWSEEAMKLAEASLAEFTELVQPTIRLDVVADDPSDNRILECAVAGSAKYIVTGDKHLLRLNGFAGMRIMSASGFLTESELLYRGES